MDAPTPHDITRLAATSGVHPETVRRAYRLLPARDRHQLRRVTHYALTAAAAELGLTPPPPPEAR